MQDTDERAPLTLDQAVAMLPDRDHIHTFRSTGMALIGADWPREKLIDAIRDYGSELSGPASTRMGHGIVLMDDKGPLFIETVAQEGNAL